MTLWSAIQAHAMLRLALLAASCLATAGCTSERGVEVSSIDIEAFGILEVAQATASRDTTSSVGAQLSHAQTVRVVRQTDRIPLKQGLSYGVAFVVNGTPPSAIAEIKAVLRSTSPCVLKETREVVYHNDSVLHVKLGEVRHLGARITGGEDNHCVDMPGPGIETFELYHAGRKLAEKSFRLFAE